MSYQLPSHYVTQFTTNVELLLQQKGSKLLPYVTKGSYKGKQAAVVDQYGTVEARTRTTKYSPLTPQDINVDRRWVLPTTYDVTLMEDNIDKLRMLNDPHSSYVQAAVAGFGRKIDDIIIDALFSDTTKTGENAGTTTDWTTFVSANSGHQIAATVGVGSNTGLNVAKLRAGKKALMKAENDLDREMPICLINAEQHDDLLAEAQIVSRDYNEKLVLVDGKVDQFLGIKFIHTERLDNNGSSLRRVPLFVPSGMNFGTWESMTTDVSIRKDLEGHPVQIYVQGTMGATRTQEKKLVEIICAE
jgi:hypothetical protein